MRPFDNIRVLDLTHVLAGPFCTYQLALLGADVIKIEPPAGPDCARGRGSAGDLAEAGLGLTYQVQGGNKRALALDLADPRGRAIFLDLVASADVVVDNYRSGGLDALGLGADDLTARNPRLVHCAISGFGADGPAAELNAYDNVIQAASGLMAATGGAGAPIKTAASIIDYATGMNAAFAIAAALHLRQLTGQGQAIDCSMLDAALMFQAPEIAATDYSGERRATPREAGLGVYGTADGLLMLGAFNPRQNRRLWRRLDREDFAEAADWKTLWAASDTMRTALETALLEQTAAAWEEEFNALGIPAQRVRSLEEALALPQVIARGYLQRNENGVTVPLTPFSFAHGGARLDRAPPRIGEHGADILAELGLAADAIDALVRDGVTL